MPSSAAMRCVDTPASPSWLNNARLASRIRSRVFGAATAMPCVRSGLGRWATRCALLRRSGRRLDALQVFVDRLELLDQAGQRLRRRHAQAFERTGDALIEDFLELLHAGGLGLALQLAFLG